MDVNGDLYQLSRYKLVKNIDLTGRVVVSEYMYIMVFHYRVDITYIQQMVFCNQSWHTCVKNIILGVLYRPHNNDVISLNESLNVILDKLKWGKKLWFIDERL